MHAPLHPTKITRTRFGEMTYFATDFYIGKSLEVYGEYSWAEVELLRKVVKPGWVVLNGGANIGALTIPIAQFCNAEVTVHAFEPQPEIFDLLQLNSEPYSNIIVQQKALWSENGTTRMRRLAELSHPNLGGLIINDNEGSLEVETVTIDSYMADKRLDLIFLDIEGCEIPALRGASKTIQNFRPLLYVEDHPGYNTGISAFVRELDYFAYAHQPLLFSPNNWKNEPTSFFGNVASFNTLCIPKERLNEFRSIVEDQTKFQREDLSDRLRMIVPRKVSKPWAGVVRCGGVGDNLIAASVCRPLKDQGYNVEVITQNPQSVVFENNPHIDKISVYDAKDWPEDLAQWQDLFRIRAKEYAPGKFVNLAHSVECKHGLVPIQTWYWWPQEYRRKLCGGSYLETAHDVFGVPHSFGPLFFPTEEEKEEARVTRAKLGSRPLIGWTLSGTRIDKVYPYTALLVSRLIKELGANVVLMGGPPPYRDLELANGIVEHVKVQNGSTEGVFHAASPSLENQIWPIRRILTFAAHCDLVIGPDTGPSWGVAFEPVPKIVLISHTSAENITKHWINTLTLHADPRRVPCWPCHRLHDTFKTCNPIKAGAHDNEFAACISSIGVEDVLSAASRLLNQGA
jgi:FkbM family methyltransferase